MRARAYIVDGDLAGKAALELADKLASLPIAQVDNIILSLREVRSIDASGVAILVRLYSRLIRSGKSLLLTEIPDEIKATLKGVGLDAVFPKRFGRSSKRRMPSYAVRLSALKPTAEVEEPADPSGFDYDPTVDTLVRALKAVDTKTALKALRTVVERLDLSTSSLGVRSEPRPAEVTPDGSTPMQSSRDAGPSHPVTARTEPLQTAHEPEALKTEAPKAEAGKTGAENGTAHESSRPPGSVTEELGWAWGAFASITSEIPAERLPKPPSSDLPAEVRDLLRDYLAD